MELLHPTVFASAVTVAKDSLKRISKLIGKYCGNESADEFIVACRENNYTESNRLLDKTVESITGYGSVSTALTVFVDKFPQLNPELSNEVSSAMSEREKVIAISHYAKQIIHIIERGD